MKKYFVLTKSPPCTSTFSGRVVEVISFTPRPEGTGLAGSILCYLPSTGNPQQGVGNIYCYPYEMQEITEEQYNNPLFRSLAKATYGGN